MKNIKKITKKMVEIVCIVGLTLVVNGVVNNKAEGKNIDNTLVKTEIIVNDSVQFEQLVESSIKDSNLRIVESSTNDAGNYIIDLNDGSYVVYDVVENKVIFQPVGMSDWSYTLDTKEHTTGCIKTYANNFKNDGIIIEAIDWICAEDDENSDLEGDVIIEDFEKVVTISKEVYESIEFGDHSNLIGNVYLEKDDILNIVYKNKL